MPEAHATSQDQVTTPPRGALPGTALGVGGLYLMVTFPLLLMGGQLAGRGWIVAAHAVAAVAALYWARTRAATALTALIVPLVAIPFLYAEIPLLIGPWTGGYHDTVVAGWELLLTGGAPSHTLAQAMPWLWFSEVVHLAYASYYFLLFVPPGILIWTRRTDAAAVTVLGLLLAGTACYLMFALFPVQGPRYFGPPEGIPHGPVRSLVLLVLENGSSRGAAFPSAHMAFMTAQTALAFRFQRRMAWLLLAATLGVGIGAVYGGFHYATDIVAGTVVGLGGAWLAFRLTVERYPRR